MTIREIIRKYLDDNGYDGLCGDECGCEKEDLAPCGCESILDCVPGYKTKCDPESCSADDECDWHMVTEKPPANPAKSGKEER